MILSVNTSLLTVLVTANKVTSPGTGHTIIDLMLELNRELGTSLVLVTHAPEIARRLQRSLLLQNGVLHPG